MTRALARLRQGAAANDGSSLAEVAVAAVLLVAVLVPTALAVVALAASPEVGVRGEALVRARSAVEETLATSVADWQSGETEDGPWRVARAVERNGGYTSVRVEVSRSGTPLVALVAGRADTAAVR